MRKGDSASTLLLTVATVLLCSVVEGAEPFRPAQAVSGRRISQVQLSPDGKRIAFTVAEPVRGEEQNQDIWIFDLDQRETLRLTTSEKPDHSPRWSPDGRALAFLSNRTGEAQIHLISMSGGEARALTKSKTPVSSFEWSPDGRAIGFLAPEAKSEEEEKKEKEKDDARVVDRDERTPQLCLLDVASQEVRQLTRGRWRISSFAWAPDGKSIVLAATDHPQPELFTTRIYSIGVDDGTTEELARPAGPFGDLKVSPDGRYLSYVGSRLDGPTPHDLFVQLLSGGQALNRTAASIDRDIVDFVWRPDGSLLLLAASGFTNRFYRMSLDGTVEGYPSFGDTHPLGSFQGVDSLLAFVGESPTGAPELWISTEPGKAEAVTRLNEDWDGGALIEPDLLAYSSFDETPIEAALFKPPGYQERAHVPAIVLVHGGPSGRWSSRFHAWAQLLATRGYAVFCPNVRGSTGYGHDFLVMNRHDWGGGDFRDIMAGVDYLVEKGIADPARLGIGGWSYGGYMAAWAVTQTDRFRVSVAGAPMTDLASEYGTEASSINAYDTWYLGSPYENGDLFRQRSPITHVGNAKTPTLILCGEKDVTDPIGQCTQLFRGLKRYGVETELVIYPREGHAIREENHQLDLLRRVVDWFDRHLAPYDGSTSAPGGHQEGG